MTNKKLSMEIKHVLIEKISPAAYNPREISDSAFEGLKESIKKFGLVDPLIINIKTGNLVGGHQRLKAAGSLGFKKVPVVEVNLSLAEEKALNITLNNQHISGQYNQDTLQELLGELKLEFDQGFLSDLRLENLFAETKDAKNTGQEIGLDGFSKLQHECPKCGFQWNPAEDME